MPEVTAAIDAFAKREGYDRSEAIRYILQDWLIGHGLLAPEPEEDD